MRLSEEKKMAVRMSLKNSFGSMIGVALHIPLNIVSASLLGPVNFGAFKIIGLVQHYASYNHLGLVQAVVRQVPLAMGRGNPEKAEEVKDICFSGSLVATLLTIVLLWLLYCFGVSFKGSFDLAIMVMVTFILIFQRADSLLHNYIKGIGHFDLIAQRNLYLNNLMPLLSLAFVVIWKLKGLVFGTLITTLITFIYYFYWLQPIRFKFKLPLKKLWELLKIGLILFINKTTDGLFWTADLTIIAIMLSRREVGLYGFALGSVSVVTGFISMLNMIIYRRILLERSRAEDTKDFSSFKKYTEYYLPLLLTISALLLGSIFLGYRFLVNVVLSKYRESLPCIILLSFGYLSFVTRYFTFSFLNATNQLRYQILYTLCATALNYGLDYLLIKAGYGIIGVAMGCTISFVIVSGLMLIHVFHNIYHGFRRGFVHLSKIVVCSALLCSLMYLFSKLGVSSLGSGGGLLTKIIYHGADAGFKLLVYLLVCTGLFSLAFRKENLFAKLRVYAEYTKEIFEEKLGMRRLKNHVH